MSISNHDERRGHGHGARHDPRPHDTHHLHNHQGQVREHEQQRRPYAAQYYHHDRRQHPQARHGDRARRSGALQWCVAVVFTVLAVAVLLAAVAILIVVLLLQPRSPYFAVRAARLDALAYDQQGGLDDVQVSATVEARNGNAHSAAAFSNLELRLAFGSTVLAKLRADTFVVGPGGRLPLAYVARARGAPLDEEGSAAMEAAIREGVVPLSVKGEARTRWKLAGVLEVRRWTRLGCQIRFGWPNGTAQDFKCSSKSTSWFF